MDFKKSNNIVGWLVCLVACTTFVMTAEKSGSFWDCGEFVSSCFKVQIPHPPGAPLMILIGRFFIILFGNNPLNAAKAVNIMSALASGFAVLFLFWTITHFARKMVQGTRTIAALTKNEIYIILAAGVVGALAFCFSDSFWYSAVEGEVYALSAFFTALVFWLILKWEQCADEPNADRWIVLIFFTIGLAIGVHLLNLLTIPSIVLIYYYKKRDYFDYKKVKKYFIWIMLGCGVLGFIAALISAGGAANSNQGISLDPTIAMTLLFGAFIAIGILFLIEKTGKEKKELLGGAYIFFVYSMIILGFVQVGVIQQSISFAGHLDIFFVNKLGLPFFTGFALFFIIVAILIWFGLRVAKRKQWNIIRLGLWCVAFLYIGFSSYITTMIRSTANPSIDMYNVDNPMSLVGYLSRDQYGENPLLYGQKFTSRPINIKYGSQQYQKGVDDNGKTTYIATGKSISYVYSPDDMMLFPRVWNNSDDRQQRQFYADWLGISMSRDQRTGDITFDRDPNFADNFQFFISYQMYYMYFRYFMWNYSGKQNDIQGTNIHDVRDGNWITGIPFIDNLMLGDQSLMPTQLKENKAHNVMFALPFILGLIGMFYHFKRKGDDAFVVFILFFMTGFAIAIYLNQAGNEPRERDYAYCGSTYAFAIWIGIGVFKVRDWLQKIKTITPLAATTVASAACFLAVPVLMLQQEWDDHDRSSKLLPPDMAKDYLNSCAKNAILFTFGDNDTYPLWYAQEVEGVRPDIRIINTSLLGIDWYINDLRTKVNESDSIDVIFTKKQIEGDRRNQVAFFPQNNIPQNKYYDLYDMLKNYVGSDDPSRLDPSRGNLNTFPVKNLYVPVDTALIRQNRTVNPDDNVLPALQFTYPKDNIFKNDLAELAVIAANKWKRPIYFTMNSVGLGIEPYLREDGMAYRLVPVLPKDTSNNALYNKYKQNGLSGLFTKNVNADYMYPTLMKQFVFGGAEIPGVYFDEENRRHLITIREAFADEAIALAKEGKIDQAQKILEKADREMLEKNFPYGMPSRYGQHNQISFKFLIAAHLAQDQRLIDKVTRSLKTDLGQEITYFNSLNPTDQANYGYEIQGSLNVQMMYNAIDMLSQIDKAPNPLQQLESGDTTSLKTIDSSKK